MQYGHKAATLVKCTTGQIEDGGRYPHFQSLNCYNSVADCPIVLKPGKYVQCAVASPAMGHWGT